MTAKRHWLANPTKETWLILAPLFLPVFIVASFPSYFSSHTEVSTLWWLVLVLLIDVGHVYSTLFRFYWEKPTFERHRSLLITIPVVCFVAGVLVHSVSANLFWRLLAYAAVYHFVRQQYGFMRMYARQEHRPSLSRWIDTVAIYSATLYPLVYWHFFLTDSLSWFVPHDFVTINSPWMPILFSWLYWIVLAAYIIKETYFLLVQPSEWSLPKNVIIVGTYLSWYAGIIYFNGDLAFTLMNVVSHGIPYMGLIWMYGEKKATRKFSFGWKGAAIFLLTLSLFAYIEEFIWDVFVWKDHPVLFPILTASEPVSDSIMLSVLIPLLVVPQLTHYVLDGFIWKFSRDETARIT